MKKVLVATVLVMSATTANATIVYNINRVIGSGSVIGFIETDETLGVLSGSNILNWSLTLSSPNLTSGGSPETITGTGGNVGGNALTATPTQLFFDFGSLVTSHALFQGGPFNNFWCVETNGCAAFLGPAESIGFGTTVGLAAEFVPRAGAGVVELTEELTGSPVPEPTTIALLGAGVVALRARRRRSS